MFRSFVASPYRKVKQPWAFAALVFPVSVVAATRTELSTLSEQGLAAECDRRSAGRGSGVGKSVLTPFNDRAVVPDHIYTENRGGAF